MGEVCLPCSVITSHGEPQDSSAKTSVYQETVCVQVYSTPNQNECPLQSNEITKELITPAPIEIESSGLLPDFMQNNNQDTKLSECSQLPPRVRKPKRPYSPVQSVRSTRKGKSVKPGNTIENEEGTGSYEMPFVCEICSSPYVVNPTRSHSSDKTYSPRRVFDPVTKKTLLVCNACRLSRARSAKPKIMKKQLSPSEETKTKFMEECTKFADSLVEQLKDSDASRLYCPVFKVRPCKCLQNYLTDPDEEEEEHTVRAMSLLKIFKKAKHLSAQKNSFSVQNPGPQGFLKRKSQMFEDFVQEMRMYLRTHLKLCERACQRVLMYSNNFLHKQLKSSPDQMARIQCNRQQLCPVAQLPSEHCCQERCVRMALTHSCLLEHWRASARRSQRDARLVLAEMLTPSGGSKANCVKFIRMVTGCSATTICLVNEQMRRTQGNREPPEHGLKVWWRKKSAQNGGEGTDSASGEACPEDETDFEYDEDEDQQKQQDEEKSQDSKSDGTVNPNIADIHIPTARELRVLAPLEAGRQLRQQRRKLARVQRQLAHEQRQLETLRQQRPPIILGCCSGTAELQSVQQAAVIPQRAPMQTVTSQPQVVHFLEIPATPASVIPSLPDASQQHATLSVLSSSGEFEPITNVRVNVPQGQPLGTVYLVPEYEAVTTLPADHNITGSNIVYSASAPEPDAVQRQQNLAPQTFNPAAPTSPLQPTTPSCPQPLHLSTMQLHLPLDIPMKLTVQPTVESVAQPIMHATVHIADHPAEQSAMHTAVQLTEQPAAQPKVHTAIQIMEQATAQPPVHMDVQIMEQPTVQPEVGPALQTTEQSVVHMGVQTSEQPPVQITLQPAVQHSETEESPLLLTHPQSIILPSPQPVSYQMTQSITPSSSTPCHVSLQSTSAAVVNIINKDHYMQSTEPQVYYLESVNCVSLPD